MNWLLFTGKEDAGETESLVAFLKSKKVPYSVIRAGGAGSYFESEKRNNGGKKRYAVLRRRHGGRRYFKAPETAHRASTIYRGFLFDSVKKRLTQIRQQCIIYDVMPL